MNQVNLIGRITKEPEIKYTPSGVAVVSFTLAVNRQYKDPNGEVQADFINCVAWRAQAEFLANYIHKGYLLAVSGSIQTRSYQDQNGKMVYVTEVTLNQVQNLEPKQPAPVQNNPALGNKPQIQSPYDIYDISDPDLPF